MNLSKSNPPRVKNLLGIWTSLWIAAVASSTLAFWVLQFDQYESISLGLEHQIELLQGGSNELTN